MNIVLYQISNNFIFSEKFHKKELTEKSDSKVKNLLFIF